MWQQWTNAILGLWIVAVPFIGMTGPALTWTLSITGIAIAILAYWGALEESRSEHPMQHRLQHQ